MTRPFLALMALSAFALSVLILGAPSAQAATLIPMKMGIAVPDPAFLSVYIAQDKGFYKAEGLDSQLVQFDSDASARMAIAANAVQVNCASIFPVIDAYLVGKDLTAIWSESNQPSYTWYGPAKFNSIKDVKGGKVAVSSIGSLTHMLSAWAVARAGLDPKTDVQFLALGGPLSRVAGLKAGQVDLVPATPPGTFLLAADGYKPLLVLSDLMPETELEAFYASKANLDRDSDLLKATIRGTIRAKHWGIAHPEEATQILMEHLGAKPEEKAIYAKTAAEALPWSPDDGRFPVDSINVFLQFYKEQGKTKDIVPVSAFTDNRFIDYFKQNPIK